MPVAARSASLPAPAVAADRPSGDRVYDLLVVGGGLAGLGGALMLSRARRSVLVIDAGHPRNAPTPHTHGYLTRDGESPLEMLAMGRAEIRRYGNDVVSGEVVAVERVGDGYRVVAADGRSWRGRRVLVTTGLVDELPDIPGLAELWGRDVVHCPYCFGWEIRDEAFGILATGPHAVAQALMWRQWSEDITVFLHTAPAPTSEQLTQLAARGIRTVEGVVVGVEVDGDDALTGVRLESDEVVPRRRLVVGPRFAARHHVLSSLGIEAAEHPMGIGSQVPADAAGRTSEPGVWVAGNVLDVSAGIMQAAASGVVAAAAINADLTREDTEEAVRRFAPTAA